MSSKLPIVRWLVVVLLLTVGARAGLAASAASPQVLVRIWLLAPDTDAVQLAHAPLTALARESLPQPYILARAAESGLAWLSAHGFATEILDADADTARYMMVDMAGPAAHDDLSAGGRLLYADESRALWRLPTGAEVHASHHAWLLDSPIRLLPRAAVPAPITVTPLPLVQEIMDQVNLARLLTYANELSGQTPALINGQPYVITTRYTTSGTPVTQAVNYMIERLQRLGLTVSTHTWNASRPPNVIAEKPGLSPGAGIYIICAHLDDMPYSGLAPGADDNGSGSIAVLQAAEILTPYHFDATLRFILFTGEEQGLYGSAAYAQMVQNEDVRGVLNMDMIAWDNTGGPNMDLHANSGVAGSMALAQVYADVVSAYGINLTPAIYSNGTGSSDHASFWNVGIPAFLVIENYWSDGVIAADFNAYYHTANDRTLYYDQTFLTNMTKASLGSFAHMAAVRTDCYWADLNCDSMVTTLDITMIADHWLAGQGQWNYSRVFDGDHDGEITIVDIQRVSAAWGWSGPG